MLKKASDEGFAFPAINITSPSTINSALKAFADLKSDGILQVSTGGGKFASGQSVGDMALGAISLASHIHLVAQRYDILIALHTDHCEIKNVPKFIIPLIEETEKRRSMGLPNLFNSHMFDGSALPFEENLKTAMQLLERCARNEIILEMETGVVGGEEDGMSSEHLPSAKLYTTPEEMVEVYKRLNPIGKFMYAATFGNVHGVYKPGHVKLRPDILRMGQESLKKAIGPHAKHFLVFHGGSGSDLSEIHETLKYGVVKMNVDTDNQYAYTRPVADHMMVNYDKVLKVDGEVGSKKHYDPRVWLVKAENSMTQRICQSIKDLKSENKSLLHR
jgi:fructose-bisphosphate aldolase class II